MTSTELDALFAPGPDELVARLAEVFEEAATAVRAAGTKPTSKLIDRASGQITRVATALKRLRESIEE